MINRRHQKVKNCGTQNTHSKSITAAELPDQPVMVPHWPTLAPLPCRCHIFSVGPPQTNVLNERRIFLAGRGSHTHFKWQVHSRPDKAFLTLKPVQSVDQMEGKIIKNATYWGNSVINWLSHQWRQELLFFEKPATSQCRQKPLASVCSTFGKHNENEDSIDQSNFICNLKMASQLHTWACMLYRHWDKKKNCKSSFKD